MKKLLNRCLKGALLMSLFMSSHLLYANALEPVLTIEEKQVSSNQVTVELGIQNMSSEVVALEVSVHADALEEVISIDHKVEGALGTYQLKTLQGTQGQFTYYLVSNDQNMPFNMVNGEVLLSTLTLKTNGNLEFKADDVSVKFIKKGYNVQQYDTVKMIYTKLDHSSDEGNNGSQGGTQAPDSNGGQGGTQTPDHNGGQGGTQAPDNTPGNVDFSDIKGHWASEAINNMAKQGVIKGYVDGSFRPSVKITRGEFATLLARAFNLQQTIVTNPFKDVEHGKWYTESVLALYEKGIVNGRLDGTFGVNDLITNEDICTMIYRTIEVLKLNFSESNPTGIQFTDNNQISSYAKEAVMKLTKIGIIIGRPDGSFGPQQSTIRAQVAVILERLLTLKK
ncbi:MAG: S-layer homology domain-containing protein [Cellulosilyticum sp.]|nr:S-layer homology domain-containing protein [Cellulosilyticum sp.]